MLSDPNPLSPANYEAARLYTENRAEYNRRVHQVIEESAAGETQSSAAGETQSSAAGETQSSAADETQSSVCWKQ